MIDLSETDLSAPDFSIDPDDAFFILMKARVFDAKTPESDPDSGSNPVDDNALDVLEERADDATEAELVEAIRNLSDDALVDLIALIWIGRGDFSLAEWDEARDAARDIGRERAPRYICGMPLVSDYLDQALSEFGFSLEDYMAGSPPPPAQES
jgi:hypothetical protein